MGEMSTVTIDAEAVGHLLAAVNRGDSAAADRLVREHEGWVRSVIFGVTGRAEMVDDIAQYVWARAWEHLDTLADPRQLRPWLYSIARHAAIDASMAARRQRTQASPLEGDVPASESRPPHVLGEQELHGQVLRAIRSLPALYREPFVLRHMEDWSYAEIADVLGLPVESVETRLVRARRLLREMLQDAVES